MQFVDLAAQRARLEPGLSRAVQAVIEGGAYILGPEVERFERALGEWLDVPHVVACANGTDALLIPLMAFGIGRGDAVFVPAFTFAATAEVVALAGATPVFCDIDPATYNLDPASLAAAVSAVEADGRLRPAAVIPVDLFGLPADHVAIAGIAARHGLTVIDDAAQGIGGRLPDGRRAGAVGDVAGTSFYPAKPLGCYGDGGAMMTANEDLAARLRSIAFHGKGATQYDNVRVGLNSRLDTVQAAVLLAKLSVLDEEMAARARIAARYADALADAPALARAARPPAGGASAFAQYAIEVPAGRDALQAALRAQGIPSVVYYPKTLAAQAAYAMHPVVPGGVPVAEALCGTVLCLPMHPYLAAADQDRVIQAIRAFRP